MKRTPLPPRKKPLKKTALKRSIARIKAKGKRRFPKTEDKAFLAWVREQPCVADRFLSGSTCNWWGSMSAGRYKYLNQAAHVRTKAQGVPDLGNVVSLCPDHHRKQHALGIRSFEIAFSVDLAFEAESLALRYQAERSPA